MNERIKMVRKHLNLSQDSFGEKIGVTGGSISLLEKGKRNITEQMLKAICREFNVNYVWLTTGEGEMFLSDDSVFMDQFNQIMFGEDRLHKTILKMAINLSADELKVIEKLIDEYQQYKKEEDD